MSVDPAPPHSRSTMLRRLAIVASLITVAASAPQSGWASCGDWLAHASEGRTDSNLGLTDWQSVLRPVRPSLEGEIPVPPAAPRQCSGPLCKQSPHGSLPAPASPVGERYHHETACVSDLSNPTGPLIWFRADIAMSVFPCRPASRIDRPPEV